MIQHFQYEGSRNVFNALHIQSGTPFAHQWTIENFTSVLCNDQLSGKPMLMSSKFKLADKHDFYLFMFPKGFGVENSDHLSLFLLLPVESSSAEEVLIQFKFYILNRDGEKCHVKCKFALT